MVILSSSVMGSGHPSPPAVSTHRYQMPLRIVWDQNKHYRQQPLELKLAVRVTVKREQVSIAIEGGGGGGGCNLKSPGPCLHPLL